MWKPSIFANIVAPLYHVLEAQEKEKSFDIAYKFFEPEPCDLIEYALFVSNLMYS